MEITPTVVDGIIAAVVLISALLAYSRGLVREVMTLVIWVAAAFAALTFYPMVEGVILDFTPRLGGLTTWAAIIATFVLALIILTTIGSMISSAVRNSALGAVDKGLGFLFGAARGLALLALVWIMFESTSPGFLETEAIAGSRGAEIVADTASAMRGLVPDEMPPYLQMALDGLFDNAPGAAPEGAPPLEIQPTAGTGSAN